MTQQITERLRRKVEEELKRWDVPSASLCIVKDGETLLSCGCGLRDNAQAPADGRTLYQIASCTKAFTAAAAAILATEGKLDFDKPVLEYIPGFRLNDRYATENLTIRDFLSHRSGLPRHEYAWYGTGFGREELMRNLKDLPLSAPIRYRFQYSNFNYLIAGALIEELSGMKFEDFLSEKLLKPLGMERSKVYFADMYPEPNHALAFDHTQEDTMEGTRQIDFYTSPAMDASQRVGDPTAAAGCVVSCAEDMAKWLKFLLNRGKVGETQLIREDLIDLLFTPHVDTGDGGAYAPQRSMTSYALGWQVYNFRGHRMLEHGGNINGFSSSTALLPDLGLGVFVSVNMNVSLLADAIVQTVMDAFLKTEDTDWFERLYKANGDLFVSVKEFFAAFGGEAKQGTHPSHALAEYAGDYEAPGYRRMRILYQDERLTLDFNTFVVGLKHHHYDSFATEGTVGEMPPGLILTFGTSGAGEIVSVSATLGTEPGLKPIVFTKKTEEGSL